MGNMAALKWPLSALLLVSAAVGSAQADIKGAPAAPFDRLFVSTNRNVDQLSDELTKLYVTLFNSGRLSLRKHVVDINSRQSIEDVFHAQKIFYGDRRDPFPVRLDSVACDLNRHVCDRFRLSTFQKNPASLTDHIAGSYPSPGFWKSLAGQTILLPDIKFEEQRRWVTVPKEATRTLADLVTRELRGCVRLDQQCEDAIVLQNRKEGDNVLLVSYEGQITLPVLRLQARINLAAGADLRTLSKPGDVATDRLGDRGLLLIGRRGENSYKLDRPPMDGKFAVDIDLVLRELGRNLVGSAAAAMQSPGKKLFAEDFLVTQKLLLQQIGMPWHKLESYPTYAKRSRVAVFDRWVDPNHCALDKQRFTIRNAVARPPGAPDDCDTQTDATVDEDHGTHVAGLIGARNKAGNSFGVNPFAEIATFEVTLNGYLLHPNSLVEISRHVADLRTEHGTDVVNFSFGYTLDSPGANDPVETAISEQKDMLFVASAGNYGTNKTYICDLRPACFDLPNVIAVAALSGAQDAPRLLPGLEGQQGTNYGMPIHIGAYGHDVFSTISGGRYGAMSGTSQAAPLVTAVASLLMAKRNKLTPQMVKNRLIYCSDHAPQLRRKLFGGRLNADCVLDSEVGRLRLEDTESVLLRGAFDAGQTVQFINAVSGREVNIPIKAVRGLYYDKADRTYVIYFNAVLDNSDSKLLRETDLKLSENGAKLTFREEAGAVRDISVAKILGYAAAEK